MQRIDVYRHSRQRLKQAAAEMPEGADWDRLAAEMTANIRVGLAAGECVAPRRGKLDLGKLDQTNPSRRFREARPPGPPPVGPPLVGLAPDGKPSRPGVRLRPAWSRC